MARIRSLKPEFWDDRKLARSTSRDARMLYMGLWNQSDEHCRLNGDALWLKGRIFPYDDDIQPDDVTGFLDQLEDAGRIHRYEHDGDPFIFLPKLGQHQRLEPAKAGSRHPAPPADLGAKKSAPRADNPAPGAEESSLLYVAGSMEHGAGSMGEAPRKPDADAAPQDETENQRAQRLTKVYVEANPMSKFPAVLGIVKRACQVGKGDGEITDALLRIARDGRSLTLETLRVEIEGQPPPGRPPNGMGRGSAKAAGWLTIDADHSHPDQHSIEGRTA